MKRIGILKCVVLVLLVSFAGLSTGCGKNTMGPTSPQSNTVLDIVSALNVISVPPSSDTTFGLTCYDRSAVWTYGLLRNLISLFTYEFLVQSVSETAEGYFTDPVVKETIKRLVQTKMFKIVTIQTGMASKLYCMALQILAQTWAPGDNTSPNGFNNPEVTLLPYKWRKGSGFYGDRLPGWGNSSGYHFAIVLPDQQVPVSIYTKSEDYNIYQNQTMNNRFRWRYDYNPIIPITQPGDEKKQISFQLFYNAIPEYSRLQLWYPYDSSLNTRILMGATLFDFDQSFISVKDRSGHFKITSTDGSLAVLIDTNADGTGGGTLDIRNAWGKLDQYIFTLIGYDKGYWTKNGGKKNRF